MTSLATTIPGALSVSPDVEGLAKGFLAIDRAREALAQRPQKDLSLAAFAAHPEWGQLSEEEQGEVREAIEHVAQDAILVERGSDLVKLGMDSGYTVLAQKKEVPNFGIKDGRLFQFHADRLPAMREDAGAWGTLTLFGGLLALSFGVLVGTGIGFGSVFSSPLHHILSLLAFGGPAFMAGFSMFKGVKLNSKIGKAKGEKLLIELTGGGEELGPQDPRAFLEAWHALKGAKYRLEAVIENAAGEDTGRELVAR